MNLADISPTPQIVDFGQLVAEITGPMAVCDAFGTVGMVLAQAMISTLGLGRASFWCNKELGSGALELVS